MFYRTVNIKPSADNTSWEASVSDDTVKVLDREEPRSQPTPNGLGFMHFPCTMPDQEAFDIMHSFLVRRHEEEIAKLQKSLMVLRKVTPVIYPGKARDLQREHYPDSMPRLTGHD